MRDPLNSLRRALAVEWSLNLQDTLAKTLDEFACMIGPAIRESQIQDLGMTWVADERSRGNLHAVLPD